MLGAHHILCSTLRRDDNTICPDCLHKGPWTCPTSVKEHKDTRTANNEAGRHDTSLCPEQSPYRVKAGCGQTATLIRRPGQRLAQYRPGTWSRNLKCEHENAPRWCIWRPGRGKFLSNRDLDVIIGLPVLVQLRRAEHCLIRLGPWGEEAPLQRWLSGLWCRSSRSLGFW